MSPQDLGSRPMVSTIAYIADRLVRTEMIQAQVKRAEAEKNVARRAGVAPSALEELRRGRGRLNVEHIGPKIRNAFVSFLEKQIAALEAELAVARVVEREVDFGAAEAAIAAAKRALGKR